MLDRYDQELLLDYLEGELDEARRAQVQAMLEDDPQLAALLEAMAQDRAQLRALPTSDAPAGLAQDVTQTLERRMLLDDAVDAEPIPIARGRGLPTQPATRGGLGRAAGLAALAASVAIAAAAVVFMSPDPLEEAANSLAEHSAGAGRAEPGASAIEALAPEAAGTEGQPDTPGGRTALDGSSQPPAPAAADTPSTLDPATPGAAAAVALRGAVGTEPAGNAGVGDSTGGLGFSPADALAVAGSSASTAAFANTAPRQQLVLFTEEPDLSQEQVVVWCLNNGIPIVEAEALHTPAGARPDEPGPAPKPQGPAATELAETADNQFALLINERQLTELVNDLNTTITIDPRRIGREPLVSNQLALVNDLNGPPGDGMEDMLRRDQTPAEQVRARSETDRPRTGAEQNDKALPQQAALIELRLPKDLGSPYANTVNRENLDYEQRRNNSAYRQQAQTDKGAPPRYGQVAQRQALVKKQFQTPGDEPAAAQHTKTGPPSPETPDKAAGFADIADAQKDAVDGDGVAGSDHKPSQHAAAAPSAAEADEPGAGGLGARPDARAPAEAPAAPRPAREPALDALRGNWLAPHLPLTDTTLILNLPTEQADEPAQLVPIAIRRAEPARLNRLKLDRLSKPGPRPEASLEADAGEDADAAGTNARQGPDEAEAAETGPADQAAE